MIRIFLPGQLVPEWLEKQVPHKGYENKHELCVIKFTSLVAVFSWKGEFIVVNTLPKRCHMSVSGGNHINISGQSPKGGNGGVHHYSSVFRALGF